MDVKNEGRLNFMQYLNTAILTCIMIVSSLLFVKMEHVTSDQELFSQEIMRLKTVQDINVKSVEALNQRVATLEFNYLDYIKTWVDQNYIRKPQALK